MDHQLINMLTHKANIFAAELDTYKNRNLKPLMSIYGYKTYLPLVPTKILTHSLHTSFILYCTEAFDEVTMNNLEVVLLTVEPFLKCHQSSLRCQSFLQQVVEKKTLLAETKQYWHQYFKMLSALPSLANSLY